MATLVQKCTACNKSKKLSAYYVNKLNKDGNGHNFQCTECVKKNVKDKLTMEEYCIANRRDFRAELWEWSEAKVETIFRNDASFNSLNEKERNSKFLERVINTYFSQHNQIQYYCYVQGENDISQRNEENYENDTNEVKSSDKKKYSSKWGGTFSEDEVLYLETQYKKAQEDYELKTTNDLEYAMNVAVAGLIVRKARSEYLNDGVGSDKKWKEAVATYDSLCTSSKFNQKTRTENTNTGLGSFGETWKRLEEMGFEPVQVTFPKDDIDIILEEYAHSHVALRGALDDVE